MTLMVCPTFRCEVVPLVILREVISYFSEVVQTPSSPESGSPLITSSALSSEPASSLFFTLMETLRIFFLVAASAGTACHPVRSAAVSSSRIALISFFI